MKEAYVFQLYIENILIYYFICFSWVAALFREYPSGFPCTTCLVPREHLGDIQYTSIPRTLSAMDEVYSSTLTMTKAAQEEVLKPYGLRPVKESLLL